MAHRIAKARRQRERALEPLPVRLRAATAQERKAERALLELHQVPLPGQREQLRELVRQDLAKVGRELLRRTDQAVVRALEQAPTIRRRGGKLPVPTGRKVTRRS